MQFSEQWLREWANPKLSTQSLADALTMAGLEISALTPASPDLSLIKVGQIVNLEPHTDSDKLTITHVDVGLAQPITVVTNVPTLCVNAKVAVATVGATLPDGLLIKETTLRGVVSQGMFCSLHTLGLADEDTGIFHLPANTANGLALDEALACRGDTVMELEITPNRGDCLSIAGLAREVSVITNTPLTPPALETIAPVSDTVFPIAIEAPELCPHYVGRVIDNVDLSQPSPLWLQEKLRRSGIRSINAVVDVSNLVMLELGQPMHAFDGQQLRGGVRVRRAVAGESLQLLDGKTITLADGQLVIADARKVLALAGIMGGEHSGVTDTTTQLFLESAYFTPTHIAANARHFNLSTDSSYRFERGVCWTLPQQAIERATALLGEIVGGQPGPVTVRKADEHFPQRTPISCRRERVQGLLGFSLDDACIERIFTQLGMSIEKIPDGWQVVAPDYRHDITIEADLIEELVRIYGYHNIPSHAVVQPLVSVQPKETEVRLSTLKDRLMHRGYQEVITYSFVDSRVQTLFDPDATLIRLANPISNEMDVMRTNLWAGLALVWQYNLNRGQKRCRFLETGLRFSREDDAVVQQAVVSGLVAGTVEPDAWGRPARPVDFFDVKSDVQALYGDLASELVFTPGDHLALHPGQQATIEHQGDVVGWVGRCHPVINERLKIQQSLFVFECLLEPFSQQTVPQATALSKYPVIRRDIGLVVDKSVSAQQLLDVVADNKPSILIEQTLFDVYVGEGLAADEKSVAISLIFQHLSHTLKETEVNACTQAIVNALNEAVGARLRDW